LIPAFPRNTAVARLVQELHLPRVLLRSLDHAFWPAASRIDTVPGWTGRSQFVMAAKLVRVAGE
jgi:hypothetical protein